MPSSGAGPLREKGTRIDFDCRPRQDGDGGAELGERGESNGQAEFRAQLTVVGNVSGGVLPDGVEPLQLPNFDFRAGPAFPRGQGIEFPVRSAKSGKQTKERHCTGSRLQSPNES